MAINQRNRAAGALVALAVMAAACAGGDAASDAESSPPTTTSTPPATTAAPSTTSTTTAPPVLETTVDLVRIAGEPELTFDWTTDRCDDEQIPDIPARAIRNADGLIQLYVGHLTTYRKVGETFDDMELLCDDVVMGSNFDTDPARYDEARWLASPYTEDGVTVYGVLHHEYRGFVTPLIGPCPLGDYISCIDVSLTMAISTDGGATFDHIAEPPSHLIGGLPYTHVPDGEPSGIWQTSNIVARDGFYYILVNINPYDDPETGADGQYACLLRSPDLADTSSWRYWDGTAFDGVFLDPYVDVVDPDELCAPISSERLLGAALNDTLIWDSGTERYVALGITFDPVSGGRYGVYASFSEDLLTWTTRQLVIELPTQATVDDPLTDLQYAYPSLIDPDSPSFNFDTSDGELYLYLTRYNAGGDSLDRDRLRYPVTIGAFESEPVTWSFDVDGDPDGWYARNQLEPFVITDGVMATTTTGEDPFMESSSFRIAADATTTLALRTRAEATALRLDAQMFFVTDEDPLWGGDKSVSFRINSEGDWTDLEVDLSTVPAWEGVVTGIRIDPGTESDVVIEFDSIELRP